MATNNTVVLVDVGNTRIKYCLLCNVEQDPFATQDFSELINFLDQQHNITHLYLASVRNPSEIEELLHACKQRNICVIEKHTEREAFGIKNSYADEKKMGVDRWLAMICAAEKTKKSFCVIDIGTAITVDFVINGQHLGGWIVPGYDVMKDALVKSTKKVYANDEIISTLTVGNDTEECVSTGCFAAVHGVYLSALDYLSSKQTDFDVILGGGGKKMFAFLESGDSICSANLVMQGLARYARSELLV